MPVNWYAALVIIVIIGVASIALAKYNYNKAPTVVEPAIGTSWHAGLAFDVCGTMEPALPASPSTATGLTTTGSGVILVEPKTSSEAGNNATLGKFADGYTGLTLTNTKLKLPLDQRADLHQRPEVRGRHPGCRQGRRRAGAFLGDLDHDLQEPRGRGNRGCHDDRARRSQVRRIAS